MLTLQQIQGTKFTDFIAAADAERAAEDLLAGSRASAPAHAFHTNLVDGCSSKFRTEVFQAKSSAKKNQRHTNATNFCRFSFDSLSIWEVLGAFLN